MGNDPMSNPSHTRATSRWLANAAGLAARSRLIGWLLLFICAYRLGLPILYAAALAALPWLLLPAVRN